MFSFEMIVVKILGLCLVLSTVSVKSDYQHRQEQQQEKVQENILPWLTVGKFDGERTAHASVVIQDRIYVIGGFFYNDSGIKYYDDVQHFQVNLFNGTVLPGSFSYTNPISVPKYQLAAVHHNGYIYIAGGHSSSDLLNDIEYGRVENDGGIQQWIVSSSKMNYPRAQHQLEIVTSTTGNTYLVAIAGISRIPGTTVPSPTDTIEVAQINTDGSIGSWLLCPFHLKGGRQWPATVVVNDRLYLMGGRGTLSLNEIFADIQSASILDNGCPSPWASSHYQLMMPLYGHKTVVLDSNVLLILGGSSVNDNYFNNIQYSTITADNTDTTSWTFAQYQFSGPRYGHSAVQVNSTYVYVIGGQAGPQEYLDDIQMSTLVSFNTHKV